MHFSKREMMMMMMMSSPVMSSLVFVSLKSLSAMHLFLKGDLNTYYYLPTEIFANSTILSLSLSLNLHFCKLADRSARGTGSIVLHLFTTLQTLQVYYFYYCMWYWFYCNKLYRCITTAACDINFIAINFTCVLLPLHVILILLP